MHDNILTNDEVAEAIRVDADYPRHELESLSEAASSFIKQKSGYYVESGAPAHPLAKTCARLYVRQLHYSQDGYNKAHDYGIGINSLIEDLKDITREMKQNV